MAHTPLPWSVYPFADQIQIENRTPLTNRIVANVLYENMDNARLIVRAVNNHHTLVLALKECAETLRVQMTNWHEDEWPETVFWAPYQAALAAIAKAEGNA